MVGDSNSSLVLLAEIFTSDTMCFYVQPTESDDVFTICDDRLGLDTVVSLMDKVNQQYSRSIHRSMIGRET